MSEQIFNTKDLILKILMLKGEKGDPGTNVDSTARQMVQSEATTRAQEIARLEALMSHPEIADGSISTEKLADLAVSTPKIDNGAVTSEKLAANAVRLRFTNKSVQSFSGDNTYTEYPFRASIPLENVTSSMKPEVVFALADAISGVFAPVAQSYNGGVYIYAKEAPNAAITIPVIDLVR